MGSQGLDCTQARSKFQTIRTLGTTTVQSLFEAVCDPNPGEVLTQAKIKYQKKKSNSIMKLELPFLDIIPGNLDYYLLNQNGYVPIQNPKIRESYDLNEHQNKSLFPLGPHALLGLWLKNPPAIRFRLLGYKGKRQIQCCI